MNSPTTPKIGATVRLKDEPGFASSDLLGESLTVENITFVPGWKSDGGCRFKAMCRRRTGHVRAVWIDHLDIIEDGLLYGPRDERGTLQRRLLAQVVRELRRVGATEIDPGCEEPFELTVYFSIEGVSRGLEIKLAPEIIDGAEHECEGPWERAWSEHALFHRFLTSPRDLSSSSHFFLTACRTHKEYAERVVRFVRQSIYGEQVTTCVA